MKNRKAQALAMNKVIVLILVLLVVILVLVAVFKLDIQKWLNFLPSFATPISNMNYVDKCPVKIAEIKDGNEIYLCDFLNKDNPCVSKTSLLLNEAKLEVDYAINKQIGQITGKTLIVIFEDIRSRNSPLFSSVAQDLPDYYYILNLDGAYLHSETEICRDEIMHEEKNNYLREEKIGVLGYGLSSSGWKIWQLMKSGYSKINSKNRIFSYNQISGETYSNLFLGDDNFIYLDKIGFKNVQMGVKGIDTNIIGIYSQYLADEPSRVNPKGFLKELNGSKIVGAEVYKKK